MHLGVTVDGRLRDVEREHAHGVIVAGKFLDVVAGVHAGSFQDAAVGVVVVRKYADVEEVDGIGVVSDRVIVAGKWSGLVGLMGFERHVVHEVVAEVVGECEVSDEDECEQERLSGPEFVGQLQEEVHRLELG